MRTALIGPTYPLRGGIAQYTTSLCRALAEQHEVLLISFKRQYPSLLFPGTTQRDASRAVFDFPHEPLLDSIGPRSWVTASRSLVRFKPDLVLFQWWHSFFAPAYCGVIRRFKASWQAPVLFLCHNILPHERSSWPGAGWILRKLTGRAFQRADGFLVHSRRLVSEILSLRPSAPVGLMFHPCYEFYSDAPTTAPRSSAAARLLFFGAIRPYKGLEVLIKALGLLHEHLDFEAVVAGEPYYDLTPSRDLAKRLGVAGRIRWLDRYIANEEVPALFSEADVVVLPYLDATQSGVVPVAYRYDVPVIASDVGGLAEVVIQEQTGFLVPPGDPQALAARILQYFQEGRKFGFQEQIRSSKGNLSWRQAIDKIFEVWELAQRRRSGLQQTPTEAEER